MKLWLAIIITIAATTGNSIGKALQKQGTKGLPKFTFESKVVWAYLRCTEWLVGIIADLAGGVLMIGAYALAPVSIVQPVSGMGLVSLAIFSQFYLKEQLQAWEWVAVAMSGVGTIGLGMEESQGGEGTVSLWRVLLVFGMMLLGCVGTILIQKRKGHHAEGPQGPVEGSSSAKRAAAMSCGLQAGVCFGLSAASCKIGMMLSSQHLLWFPIGMATSITLTSMGLILQNRGFKDGNTVLVCTCASVTAMVSGVAVGVIGLGEALPATLRGKITRITSWTMILAGVSMIANGPEGAQVMAAMLASFLPRRVLNRMPTTWAVRLRQTAQKLELPTKMTANAHTKH